MSTNLTLAFDRFGLSGPITCFERHRLQWQDYDAFDRISAEAIPLVDGVLWYEDEGVKHQKTDPYGNPLTFMAAHSIARHLSAASLHGFDAATLVFIKALPPETRVVLWWD